MEPKTAFEQFRATQKKIHAYGHAGSMLYYDSVTGAPSDSDEGRGETLAILSEAQYSLSAGKETLDLVAFLKQHLSELSEVQQREVIFFDRGNEFISSIPQDEYVAYDVLLNKAQSVWHKAKADNDFAAFAPYLEQIVETNRRFAHYYKPDLPAYDVLLDQYEHGLTMQKADAFFAALREKIVPLLRRTESVPQIDDALLFSDCPIAKQREFSDYLMQVMGIDRSHCAIDETEHPFTINFNKKDVRITTHYHADNFTSSMFSVIHEGGHALYELGSGDEYEGTVLSGGVSMGVHESQSRLFENIIGRSEAFINLIFPKIVELFPQFAAWNAHQFWLAVNKTQPSLIRTEADELTYPLHIMVRYEIEKKLIDGSLAVRDLPRVWGEKMREYLGIAVPDDRRGVLQDSHWSGGSIGYFPSYALGSAYGAQIMARMRRDLDPDAAIAAGSLQPIVDWLTEHIFRHGCRYDPNELIERCCGAPFDPTYYTDYLEKKFTAVYGLK